MKINFNTNSSIRNTLILEETTGLDSVLLNDGFMPVQRMEKHAQSRLQHALIANEGTGRCPSPSAALKVNHRGNQVDW